MLKLLSRLLVLIGFAAIAAGSARAQSISISPTMPWVSPGGTVQFSAQVTGLSSTSVTWSAGGVRGGSSTSGAISAAGLYTAPTVLPAQNPVQITAVSTVNKSISATTYVNLYAAPCTISAVSPDPINPGNISVTITGTGIVDGATVFISYGNNTNIQMSAGQHTSTSVSASGYLGPATSATFCVKNPGSTYSNSLTVPVGNPPPPTYSLTVNNGSGGGSYAAGSVVTITANAPPAGQIFTGWSGAKVSNPAASTTTLTMPASNVTVTANYAIPASYTLTVVNGTGSGTYTAGSTINIAANAPPAGQQFVNWTGATVQNAGASSTSLTMPSANTTVTANYAPVKYALTVVNGTGSGQYPAGTGVNIAANAAPTGQQFLNWTGTTVQNPNAAATTITMPAGSATVTANYTAQAVNIPFPVTSHPRLWITVNDLPRLRNWASASNPVYAQGMASLISQAVSVYQTQFFPNGAPNPNYPDPGDVQGYSGYLTEQYGMILAFNSLIDQNPSNRILYAQYARNLLMYAMNQAALGHQANAPFRDPAFAIYNRANANGELWPLIVDWIYNAQDASGNPILTASDKATIRNVFLIWANDCLNASTTGGDHPSPIGATNSLLLLPGAEPYRMASNNYYLGHARLLTMMALSMDPSDDPTINPNAPASMTGNTLRSYILNANGAWLYQEFAMMGDPATVASAYGISGNGTGFGLASGGLPPEGMLYGHSFGYILGQLLALQTAGFNNVAYTGPQIQLIGAPVWDRFITGMLSSLTPTAQVPATESYLGSVYEFASYGDLLRLWVTPDAMEPFALLTLLEQENGSTQHLNAARWYSVNAMQGGAPALMSRIRDPWTWGPIESILYFLLLDPAAPAATDPRPSLPTNFFDPAAGRVLAHSDWSPSNTMFTYRASWISINHQDGDGGQFELYRNGEWLTKQMSNYDNNGVGITTLYHNALALQNWCPNGTPNLNWFEGGEWTLGSQWMEGLDAGDPTTIESSGPGYVYAASDLTNLYNRPDIWNSNYAAMDITQATRSILWLNDDYIVVYDRAASNHSGLFKQFNFCTATSPSITGNTVTETLASGQQLFCQTLLPTAPQITAANDAGNLNPIADLEPMRYIVTVQDPTKPATTRFLHVLQGADPGEPVTPAAYLQSTTGTAFDGAVFGGTAVFFPVTSNATFSATTFTLPAGTQTLMVTGLTANAGYTVSVQTTTNGIVVTVTPGGNTAADGAGVLSAGV